MNARLVALYTEQRQTISEIDALKLQMLELPESEDFRFGQLEKELQSKYSRLNTVRLKIANVIADIEDEESQKVHQAVDKQIQSRNDKQLSEQRERLEKRARRYGNSTRDSLAGSLVSMIQNRNDIFSNAVDAVKDTTMTKLFGDRVDVKRDGLVKTGLVDRLLTGELYQEAPDVSEADNARVTMLDDIEPPQYVPRNNDSLIDQLNSNSTDFDPTTMFDDIINNMGNLQDQAVSLSDIPEEFHGRLDEIFNPETMEKGQKALNEAVENLRGTIDESDVQQIQLLDEIALQTRNTFEALVGRYKELDAEATKQKNESKIESKYSDVKAESEGNTIANYTGDIIEKKGGLLGQLSGMAVGLISTVGGGFAALGGAIVAGIRSIRIGTILKKVGGPIAIATSLISMITDGFEGLKLSEDWGVSKASGMIGAILGGLDDGVWGAVKGAGKWAIIGAGVGSVVPVVGTIVGGLLGAAVGGLLGWFGGEAIAKMVDGTWGWIKSKLTWGWRLLTRPFVWLGDKMRTIWEKVPSVDEIVDQIPSLEDVGNLFLDVGNSVSEKVGTFTDKLTKGMPTLSGLADNFHKAGFQILASVGILDQETVDRIPSISEMSEKFMGAATSIKTAVGDFAKSYIKDLPSIEQITGKFTKAATSVKDAVGSFAMSYIEELPSIEDVSSKFLEIGTGVRSAVGFVRNETFKSIPSLSTMLSMYTGMVGSVREKVGEYSEAVVNSIPGMSSIISYFKTKVGELVDSITNFEDWPDFKSIIGTAISNMADYLKWKLNPFSKESDRPSFIDSSEKQVVSREEAARLLQDEQGITLKSDSEENQKRIEQYGALMPSQINRREEIIAQLKRRAENDNAMRIVQQQNSSNRTQNTNIIGRASARNTDSTTRRQESANGFGFR